ncbi:MAG: family 20 glycosylhydrolase [Bacteroidetes bacterium]|jgi:hypothetical protein|nr:family 20 glycosylhydrolase [Bacteroidota bacterium]
MPKHFLNGLLVDCSRVLERHEYYFRLVDLMAEWGMNTLQMHFSDDHGLAVQLPGLEHIAMPHAMSAETVGDLVDHAARHDITVIPELETFGHIRYVTDHPDYQHLAAWHNPQWMKFNAIDPLSLEAFALLKRLIAGVCELFPSRYVHIGCDEVNISRLCKRDNLDAAVVWTDHVNRIIHEFAARNRVTMFWADHAVGNERIRELLDKNAVAVHWHYDAEVDDEPIEVLQAAGFGDVILAPVVGSHLMRFLPTEVTLSNIRAMATHARTHETRGVITAQWEPYRYPQRAMDYATAFAAEAVRAGGRIDRDAFDRTFAREAFDLPYAGALAEFLAGWTALDVPPELFQTWVKNRNEPSAETRRQVRAVNEFGHALLPGVEAVEPKRNADVWEAMVLAARCAWICSEAYMVHHRRVSCKRAEAYNEELDRCRKDLAANWDATRFPDDPNRNKARFKGIAMDYALLALRRLPPL